jgi:hypothetical protein
LDELLVGTPRFERLEVLKNMYQAGDTTTDTSDQTQIGIYRTLVSGPGV